jgi:hypothetical protein
MSYAVLWRRPGDDAVAADGCAFPLTDGPQEVGGDVQGDAGRYLRLAQAALKPLAKPTDTMIDAAHAAVWSDRFWAINSRRDFQKAVRAMILAALKAGDIDSR